MNKIIQPNSILQLKTLEFPNVTTNLTKRFRKANLKTETT
jgi:hypothetical protein